MSLSNLLIEPWLVQLRKEEAAVYAAMRESEDQFVQMCIDAGARILDGPRRSALVVVPQGCTVPPIPTHGHAEWAAVLAAAVAREGKHATIGVRSTEPPHWLSDRVARKVGIRSQAAARGAIITAAEAIDYLNGRYDQIQANIGRSKQAHQHERAAKQEEMLERIQEAIKTATQAIRRAAAEGKTVSAQLSSGESWRVIITYIGDTKGTACTVHGVGLVRAATDWVLVEPHTRQSAARGEVIDAGPIRLILR